MADPILVSPNDLVAVTPTQVYAGEQISGASVAAVRGRRLLVGAIADTKFLDCTMP